MLYFRPKRRLPPRFLPAVPPPLLLKPADISLSRESGFSLIELAVVLMILGLLLGALLRPLRAQVETQQYQEAERALDDIREAIIGFALANGRLPCPANGTVPSGTASAGVEVPPGGPCTNSAGVVPWATLGTPELDPWGRRYSYRVKASPFADAIGAYASFTLSATGDIQVRNQSAVVIAANLPAIFLSHGKNGLGAYRPDGTIIGSPAAAGGELENSNGDANFAVEPQGDSFDDVVRWIPGDLLKNRMVTAGRLP
jgi:prepilin-type N-terminal cleavage/methylation domain-containing protein